jgi:hypothetical protein
VSALSRASGESPRAGGESGRLRGVPYSKSAIGIPQRAEHRRPRRLGGRRRAGSPPSQPPSAAEAQKLVGKIGVSDVEVDLARLPDGNREVQ